MLKKVLFLITILLTINIMPVKADITIDEVIDELQKSHISDKTEIITKDDKLIIKDNNNETIFEINNNILTYSSNEDKEILKESTIWIEELTKIILSKFNYNNDIDINTLNFEDNGIEGVKNKYVSNNQEIYYYYYYKVSLEYINLDKNTDNNINEIKEDNTINEEDKYKESNISQYTTYIKLFCFVIIALMLILNASIKK